MNFEFATATRIVFGEGRLGEVGPLASTLGSRALVVRGSAERAEPLLERLRATGMPSSELHVQGEPTVSLVETGVALARAAGCDLVVGFGGGSVIDAAKAVAILLGNPGAPREYLEVVGAGRPIERRGPPLIAIPTTAGTGSEVTRNAVLAGEEERVKVSLRSPLMLPAVALVDPELTCSLPPSITASTGLDALTQCIEPFVSPASSPLTDALAREGIRRAAGALSRAYRDGSDRQARRDMAIASLCGGLSLANAALGAVHGFAAPLGGMFPVPHGVACARLLPLVVEANVAALRLRAPESPAVERYAEIARILTRFEDSVAEDAAVWLGELIRDLEVPGLAGFGLTQDGVPAVVEKARRANSMRGNPIVLTDDELAGVLTAAL